MIATYYKVKPTVG